MTRVYRVFPDGSHLNGVITDNWGPEDYNLFDQLVAEHSYRSIDDALRDMAAEIAQRVERPWEECSQCSEGLVNPHSRICTDCGERDPESV